MPDVPDASARRQRLGNVVLLAFVVCAAAHLTSIAVEIDGLAFVTKALLMPLLAGWVAVRGGPRLIIAALLFSMLGDVALEFDGLFIAGMGAFAAAHVCYVTYFVRCGVAANLWHRWPVVAGYAVVWVGLVVLLWPGLGALQTPVAAYSLLLTATGMTSAGYGLRTGLGGALFFVSDTLLALGIAEMPRPPMPGLWVMSTYIAAQYLLASGCVARDVAQPHPAVGATAGADR